jgi:pimeloyl-ACP methyl ester carboxylesterase
VSTSIVIQIGCLGIAFLRNLGLLMRRELGTLRFALSPAASIGSRAGLILDLVRNLNRPVLVVYGDETPPRSRAEMEALAELPNVRMERLPKGKLSIHEEFPASVASIIRPFLMV